MTPLRVGRLLLVLGAAAGTLRAQTIDTIVVVVHNVYDRNEGAPRAVAAVGNALHVTTHAGVIRRTLLVKAGEPYDSAKIAESERELRALTIFRAVAIDTVRLDGRLALRVVTDDAWSTIPDIDYASIAGSVAWALALTEGNFLGTGTALTGRYEKDPDRHTISVGYNSTGVLGRRTVLSGEYDDISDGHAGSWLIGVPFYETVAPRSLTTSGVVAQQRVLQFRDGVLADSVQHRELLVNLTGGAALSRTPTSYSRLWISADWRREDFAPAGTVPFPRSQFGAVGGGIEIKQVRFQVVKDFNAFARDEDIDVSELLHLGAWVAPRSWGYAAGHAGIGPELDWQLGGAWSRGFAVFRGNVAGLWTGTRVDSGAVQAAATVVSQNLGRQWLILHVEGGALQNPKPGDEFDLWRDEKGPRLFGAHALTGTRMEWLAVEDRVVLKDEVWGLFGVGMAPFFDYGGAWYADESQRAGGDAGVALRLGPTRLTITDVGQFALGYRWGKGFTGRHWAFTATGNILY